MGTEYDPLQAFDPFLGTLCAVGTKIIGSVVGSDGKVDFVFVRVGDAGGYAIP